MSAPYTALVSALCTRRIGKSLDNNNEQEEPWCGKGDDQMLHPPLKFSFSRAPFISTNRFESRKFCSGAAGDGTGNGTGERTEKNGATKNRDLFSERTEFVGPLKARPATSREGHDCVADRKEWRGEGRRPKGGCADAPPPPSIFSGRRTNDNHH